jgi:hypothetical protein
MLTPPLKTMIQAPDTSMKRQKRARLCQSSRWIEKKHFTHCMLGALQTVLLYCVWKPIPK